MEVIRRIWFLVLVVLLAACANTVTPPTPEPPVGDPTPTPPGDTEVPYAGYWHVVFSADDNSSFVHALDITTAYTDSFQSGAYGSQQLCTGPEASPCNERSNQDTGIGFIGTIAREDGSKPLSLTIYDGAGLKVQTTENLTIAMDAQGRQVLSGPALWLNSSGSSSDRTNGTVTATNMSTTTNPPLGDPIPDGTLTGSWDGTTNLPTMGALRTGFFFTQAGGQLSGEIFIFPKPGNEVSITLQGAVTSNIVTLIAKIPFEGELLAFAYQGTLSGTTLSGQVTVQPADGTGTPERGDFTVTKSAQ